MIEIEKYSTEALRAVRPAEFLPASEWEAIEAMGSELQDTFEKVQRWRTETEMRVSVLNDGQHPTKASKYWQAVKEQSLFFEQLVMLSFDYRKTLVDIKRAERELAKLEDELDREEKQIEIERALYNKKCMEAAAKDRVRELKLWSKIKGELNDGSFDDKDVNTDQLETLHKRSSMQYQVMSQTGGSPESVNNVRNILMTASKEQSKRQGAIQ